MHMQQVVHRMYGDGGADRVEHNYILYFTCTVLYVIREVHTYAVALARSLAAPSQEKNSPGRHPTYPWVFARQMLQLTILIGSGN